MFMLTQAPLLYPATTLLGNSGGPVVDTGIDMLAGGRVYIDRVEAGEIAHHFGFETPEAAERRDHRIEQLEADLETALAKLRRVGELVAGEVLAV